MAKVTKTKASTTVESKITDRDASWIPTGPKESSKKKQDLNISTILELKHISTNMDKFGRSCRYFSCLNPEALNIVKEYIDAQGLNIEQLSLPFWQGDDTVMLRVGAQSCGLSDDVLNESSLTGLKIPVDFKYYSSSKGKAGFSINM